MKRVLSLILVLCMLVGAMSYAVPAGAVTYGYTRGDADDSTEVTTKDVLLVRKFLAGISKEKELNCVAADADEDSDVTTKDVLYIRKMLAGLLDEDGNNTDDRYKVDTATIDGKNISRYTVVVSDSENDCMVYSAQELKKYVQRACGITLNIAYAGDEVETYKINYVFDEEDEFSLGKEGYRIAVEETGDVTFYCGSVRGPLYATYFFLEEFMGYRFLFGQRLDRSELDPYIYESENVNIPMGYDETEVPILSYRAASQGGSTSFNFAMLRNNAVDGAGSRSCTDTKYGGGVGTLFMHAHSFEEQLKDMGINPSNQPCLSSEETYLGVLEYNVNLIETRNSWGQYFGVHYTQIACSPNDNTNFCKCSSCSAIYNEEGSIAGTVFRLANRVAETMGEMYPGLEIFTIAYWDARNPPKYTRPHENVCVCFCFGGCNNHPYDSTELCAECGGNPRLSSVDFNGNAQPQSNVLDIEYYKRWTELTNNIYVWYYSANFIYYIAPAPNLFNIYYDFRYLAATGTAGIYSEGSSHPYYNFEFLRGHLASKMMWNPLMSEEEFNAILNEYLMIYYGPGWESVRELIEMTDYASDINGCWTNNYDRPWNMYNEEYFCENYHKMHELIETAMSKAETFAESERCRLLTFHIDFLGLSATYERDWKNGDASSKELYKERYQALYDMIVDYNSDGSSGNHLKITSYGTDKGYAENFPTSRDDIRSPMTWIFDDFTGYWEWDGTRWQ